MSKITDHFHVMPLVRISTAKQDQGSNESQDDKLIAGYQRAVPEGKVMKTLVRIQSGREKDPKILDETHKQLSRKNRYSSDPVTLILVDTWDRYFRNQEAGWYYIRLFQKIGVEINCLTRWIDFDNAMSKQMLGLELAHAEQVSDDTSNHVIRCYSHKVERGILPVARLPRIYKRTWITRLPKNYIIEQTEAFEPFAQACDLILGGVEAKAAWRDRGGREVLGSYDSFLELIRNELIIPRYRGNDILDLEGIGEAKFHALQRELARRKPVSRTGKTLHEFFLKPTLACPRCGKPLTSDRAKSGKHNYYTCFHSKPRHYRLPAGEVHTAFDELLEQLTLQAGAAQLAGKKAVERSKQERARAEADVKRLRAELRQQVATEQNAVFLFAEGKLSERQFKMLETRKATAEAELRAAENLLENHGRILENVLKSLQQIGLVFRESINRAMVSHFVRMAFPDGLVYDRKNRIFRTTSMNAALSLIPEIAGGSAKLKTRLPTQSASNRVMSGSPGLVRTPATDLQMYWAYLETAKLIA